MVKELSLRALANRFGTDKEWLHHYMEEYERHFSVFRDHPIKLLEIGVGGYTIPGRGGNSLRMWEQYFRQGEIHGIDIEDKSFVDRGNIKTHIVDQTDEVGLRLLDDQHGPFNIVVDDGSHIQEHTLKSFYILFPRLVNGGIYVIEDLETAYRPSYGGSPDLTPPNTVGLIQRLIDGLQWENWGQRKQGPTEIDKMIKSVHVSKEIAFIYKK